MASFNSSNAFLRSPFLLGKNPRRRNLSTGNPEAASAAREVQTRRMLDSLYFRLAEVTGREADEIRDGARARRVLTAAEAQGYGLVTGRIERRRRV